MAEPGGQMLDVLIVDDDAPIRDFLIAALGDEGYTSRTASDGQQALQLIQQHHPRLVLLDMTMPTMDGPTFCRTLSDIERRALTLVVMSAATNVQAFRAQCGADDVLHKPFALDALYGLLERYLRSA